MSTQRKAWNEAMKKAARGTMLPVAVPVNRRSGRSSKNKRREKARKVWENEGGKDGGGADLVEFRIDSLEEASSDLLNMVDDDDEYDELEDMEESSGSKKRSKRKAKKSAGDSQSGNLPKKFKARSLASILIEESTRGPQDGVLQQYLNAEAIRPSNDSKALYPKRKFCSVTGLEGLYKDPKTGIYFASLTALEQLRERTPPWISGMGNVGTATYYEAVRSLKNDDDT